MTVKTAEQHEGCENMTPENIARTAQAEIEQEEFRCKVEEEKRRIMDNIMRRQRCFKWFPWRIRIERRDT
jgi:hypothetical protein